MEEKQWMSKSFASIFNNYMKKTLLHEGHVIVLLANVPVLLWEKILGYVLFF